MYLVRFFHLVFFRTVQAFILRLFTVKKVYEAVKGAFGPRALLGVFYWLSSDLLYRAGRRNAFLPLGAVWLSMYLAVPPARKGRGILLGTFPALIFNVALARFAMSVCLFTWLAAFAAFISFVMVKKMERD